MMRKQYRFGGLEIQVEMSKEQFYQNAWNLEFFSADSVTDPHRFRYEVQDEVIPPEGEPLVKLPSFSIFSIPGGHIRYMNGGDRIIRCEHRGKDHRILVKKTPYTDVIGAKTALECMEVEHLLARNHGFLFHCSYIEKDRKAILFTAPSETGKSTQAELWKQYRGADIINGDRAAVRLVDGQLIAEGTPYAGSSRYCKNRSLPIAAIVYLGQAPVTTIRKMHGYEAFSKIWEGVCVNTWDKTDMDLVSGVVQMAAEKIPVFHLPCTPDESAVIALEQELRKQEQV